MAPNGYQVYNDYASPERTYSSERAVVHYVEHGIDAPPLNDDDADGVPDYVELVGRAADRALAYYERRGFWRRFPTRMGLTRGPTCTSRASCRGRSVSPSRLPPRPAARLRSCRTTSIRALSGASRASTPLWRTSSSTSCSSRTSPRMTRLRSHRRGSSKGRPPRSRLGSHRDLDDLVSTLQLRGWFAATGRSIVSQSYGAQLLWRSLDTEQPRFLPALLQRLAAEPPPETEAAPSRRRTRGSRGGRSRRRSTRFAVALVGDHGDVIEPVFGLGPIAQRSASSHRLPCTTSVRYCRGRQLFAHRHLPARTWLGVRHHDLRTGERGGGRAAVLSADRGTNLRRRPDDDVRSPGAGASRPATGEPAARRLERRRARRPLRRQCALSAPARRRRHSRAARRSRPPRRRARRPRPCARPSQHLGALDQSVGLHAASRAARGSDAGACLSDEP